MCFYIRDEGRRGGYKEGTEHKQERERGAQRGGGEGAVKRNGGGRREREREAVDRDRAESGRALGRETEIRDEERGERTTPSSSSGCDSERRRYLDQSNHAAGSAFYHYFTCFPFTSPSLDDIPRAIPRDKKRHPLPEEDSMLPPGVWCPPVPSWYLPWSSRDLLQRGILSRRSRHLLLACPLHVQ